MAVFWRVLRTGLSSLRDRAGARLAALRFNPSRLIITRTFYRPLSETDRKHFDAAFAEMDAAFAKMDKAFRELGKIK